MDSRMLRLVFHDLQPGPDSAVFAEAAREVSDAAPDSELRLVSPYIGRAVLEKLTAQRAFRLVTDLDACLSQQGSRRLEHFLARHVEAVRDLPGVHAKVVLTEGALLLGSANLTREGFAERDEFGCVIRDAEGVAQACGWFDALWKRARKVSKAALHDAAERGRDLSKRAAAAGATARRRRVRTADGSGPAPRSLGWLGMPIEPKPARTEPPKKPATRDELTERRDLVQHLRRLTASAVEARLVLDLCGQAIEVSGLETDSPQLHLNFGKRYLSVTVGPRDVVWGRRRARGAEFAFILSDPQLAERTASAIEGAWASSFGTRRGPDAPTLHVPVSRIRELPEAFFDDWKKAIRAEAARRTRAGRPPASPYANHKRPYLAKAAKIPALAAELAEEAHGPAR